MCSPVVGVEALKVGLNQAVALECMPCPMEVSGEASEGHVFTQDIHLQLHSGVKELKVMFLLFVSDLV